MTGLPPGFTLVRHAVEAPLETVVAAIAWEERHVVLFGQRLAVPRLTAWMGDAAYAYSGIRHDPAPAPDVVLRIQRKVHELAASSFNSVLANLYRNGRDSVAWHADDERELGEAPTIASVSLGAPRLFQVRPRSAGRRAPICAAVMLHHGDVLIMHGRSQADYLHAVPKTGRSVGPRVNLTFRKVV